MSKLVVAELCGPFIYYIPNTYFFACRKGREAFKSAQRVKSPEAMPLARGLGTAQVPKTVKRRLNHSIQPPLFNSQAATSDDNLAAFFS